MKKTSPPRKLSPMFTFGLENIAGAGFDPLVLLLMAVLLEAYFGRLGIFKIIPHPVSIIGGAIRWLEIKLNRDKRSNMDRAIRGAISVLIIVIAAGVVGWGIAWLSLHQQFGWVLETALLLSLLAGRDLFDRTGDVMNALEKDGVKSARVAVAHIVGRDPVQLDQHGIARASIESLAENFSDAVIAPMFWYVLFGFPGILIYKAVNTMDSEIGYMSDRYRAFGMVAARLDDVLNLAPARLAALMIAFASFVAPKANPWGAFKTMLKDAGKHTSPNAGWVEAAMAGALGIALAGPRKYTDTTVKAHVKAQWIGNGSAKALPSDIKRALYIYAVAMLLSILVVAVIAVFRLGI